MSSGCFDLGLGIEAVEEGIIQGVYVLQDYATSYWLDHMLRGLTDRKTSGCPEDFSRSVEEMIERRKNLIWEGSCSDCAPLASLKSFQEEAPEVFETLMYIHSFLQKRWRELSLADGKSACKSRRLYTLIQILARRIVGKQRPSHNFRDSIARPSAFRSGSLSVKRPPTGLCMCYDAASVRIAAVQM